MKNSPKQNISQVELGIKLRNETIANKLQRSPQLISQLLDPREIWYPEWEHFKIVKVNDWYLLFDNHVMVYRNHSLETVKSELVEHFHFFDRAKKEKMNLKATNKIHS